MDKTKLIIIISIIIVLGLLTALFYPKKIVVGGLRGGPITPGASAYLEEYKCFGIKQDFCPPWPDYGCDRLCYGLTYDKTCSIQSFESDDQITSSTTTCK